MKYILIALLFALNAFAEEDPRQIVDCDHLRGRGFAVPGEKFSIYLPPELGYDAPLKCRCATKEEKEKALKLGTEIGSVEKDE